MEYRKEIKYIISDNDFNIINENLKMLLKKDKYCINDFYTITSIYFDNYKKASYNQVKCGVSERWKYRIRFYNYDDSFIKLEKKYKDNNLIKKSDINISIDILNNILNNSVKIDKNNTPLLNEFILRMKSEFLRPVMCIEYDRVPYVYKFGNVRITLDYNIRYNNKFDDLFNAKKRMYHINSKVLEVKYNEFIPDFISRKIGLNTLSQTSFSKFLNSIDRYKGGNLSDI